MVSLAFCNNPAQTFGTSLTIVKDHTGDPSTFPGSADLIVGPGFKEAFVPGYPTVEDSPVDEKAWEGRTLREINFDSEGKGLKIGQYNAFDFYGESK